MSRSDKDAVAETNSIHYWSLLAVPILILGGGCAGEGSARRSAASSTLSGASVSSPQTASAYAPSHRWQTDRGDQIKLENFKGHPVVIAMFYTTCHLVCPITLENLQWINSSLDPTLRGQVPMVLVSIDSSHDSIGVLRSFRSANHLATNEWILLRGETTGIRDLAGTLQIPLPRDPGSLHHSSHIVLLDKTGRVRGRQTGLHQDLKPFLNLIRECAEDPN